MSDEIEPYVLYRVEGAQLECALWQLEQGDRALALFLSQAEAEAYREEAGLGGWQVLRPSRDALRQLLQACADAGVRYAVLAPDRRQAKRLFDLRAVLEAARGGPAAP
jgi:hypothetical protein